MAQFDPESDRQADPRTASQAARIDAKPKTDTNRRRGARLRKKQGRRRRTKADQKTAQAEKERIEKENKRKQDEYQQKIADGKKRVAELNARFADWYYVISDEVYRKIDLSRSDIIKKKEKKADQAGEGKEDRAGAAPRNRPDPSKTSIS